MFRYLRYWRKVSLVSFLSSLTNRLSFFIFVVAKTLRISLYFVFLSYLLGRTSVLAGYEREEVIFFFLNFLLIDSLSQLLLRGVYFFRDKVVDGSFDYVLIRPINVLFNVLGSHADVQDLLVTLGLLLALVLQALKIPIYSLSQLVAYLVLFANGFLIAVSFHIMIAALILVSLDVDHAILVYRDLESLLRFPVEIYREPVRFFLTFIVPLGVMVAFPAKAFLGLLTPPLFFISFLVSTLLFFVSLKVWNLSLKTYSSASS